MDSWYCCAPTSTLTVSKHSTGPRINSTTEMMLSASLGSFMSTNITAVNSKKQEKNFIIDAKSVLPSVSNAEVFKTASIKRAIAIAADIIRFLRDLIDIIAITYFTFSKFALRLIGLVGSTFIAADVPL